MTEQERQDQAELESFGTTYTNSRGARCLRLGMLGVRIDACRPFKGTVESFRAIEGSGWWELNIRERQGEHFFLHNNRGRGHYRHHLWKQVLAPATRSESWRDR